MIEVSQAQMPSILLLLVLLAAVIVAVFFAVKSGDRYSVEDAERDAVDFAGIVTEASGPVTIFLVIAFAALIVWGIVYLILYL